MSIGVVVLLAQAAAALAPQDSSLPPVPPPPPPPVVTLPPLPKPDSKVPLPPVPRGNPGLWVMTNDYPAAALRDEIEGATAFQVQVDALGRPVACMVVETSGSPLLDQTTCELITRRARFIPAQDGKGHFLPGTYSGRVRWVIPEHVDAPDPFREIDGRLKPALMSYSFNIEKDGTVSDCVLTVNDRIEVLQVPEGPCAPAYPYKPFTDGNGKPVRKRATFTIETKVEDRPG